MNKIEEAVTLIKKSKKVTVFLGAGFGVESGFPTFRGDGESIWNKYDPEIFHIDYFKKHPKEVWSMISKVFLDEKHTTTKTEELLCRMLEYGFITKIITQNITDKLPCFPMIQLHGTIDTCTCVRCGHKQITWGLYDHKLSESTQIIETLPFDPNEARCEKCDSFLRPDILFFGEEINDELFEEAMDIVHESDVLIIIGTSGTIDPAAGLVYEADMGSTQIIEINIEKSKFTDRVTNVFIQDTAENVIAKIAEGLDIDGIIKKVYPNE